MANEKLIVALLLIAIVFSVLTLVISLTTDVVPAPESTGITEYVGTASVVLEIIPRSSIGGGV